MVSPLDNLLERIGKSGRCQVSLLLLLGCNYLIVAVNHALPGFHGYTPPFHCKTPLTTSSSIHSGEETKLYECETTVETGNETWGLKACLHGYEFHTVRDESTIVTEWELVCDRKVLRPLVATVYFCGVTVGAILFGILSDKLGRRPVMLFCLYSQGALGISLYFVHNLLVFMSVRFIQGVFIQGLQGTTYALLVEMFPPRLRTAVGVVLEVYWALGLALLAGAAYFVPNWRNLQLSLGIPTAVTILYIWIVPESARWLLAHGKVEQARKVIEKLATYNGINVTDELGPQLKEISQAMVDSTAKKDGKDGQKQGAGVLDLMIKPHLRKYSLTMFYIWFCVSLSYYAIMFHIPDLSGERHVNFLIGAGLELVSYVIAYFILSRFGRRIPLSVYLLLSGGICISVGTLSVMFEDASNSEATISLLKTGLALVGKSTIVSCFCAIFIYSSELFPTVLRAAAMGQCAFWGRVGSLLAPQVLLLGDYTYEYVPFVTFGSMAVLASLLALVLPETLKVSLPDTVEEAECLEKPTENMTVFPESGDVGYGKSPSWVEVNGLIVSQPDSGIPEDCVPLDQKDSGVESFYTTSTGIRTEHIQCDTNTIASSLAADSLDGNTCQVIEEGKPISVYVETSELYSVAKKKMEVHDVPSSPTDSEFPVPRKRVLFIDVNETPI